MVVRSGKWKKNVIWLKFHKINSVCCFVHRLLSDNTARLSKVVLTPLQCVYFVICSHWIPHFTKNRSCLKILANQAAAALLRHYRYQSGHHLGVSDARVIPTDQWKAEVYFRCSNFRIWHRMCISLRWKNVKAWKRKWN